MEDDFSNYIDESLILDSQQFSTDSSHTPIDPDINSFEPFYINQASINTVAVSDIYVNPSSLLPPTQPQEINSFLAPTPSLSKNISPALFSSAQSSDISKLIADLLEQNGLEHSPYLPESMLSTPGNFGISSANSLNSAQLGEPQLNNISSEAFSQLNTPPINPLTQNSTSIGLTPASTSTDVSQLSAALNQNLSSKKSSNITITQTPESFKPRNNITLAPKSIAISKNNNISNPKILSNICSQNYDLKQIDSRNFSAKELRQIRNKLSARNFRVRRKEYISNLEEQVESYRNENDDLKDQLQQKESVIVELNFELNQVKKLLENLSLSSKSEKYDDSFSNMNSCSPISSPDLHSDSTSFSTDISLCNLDKVSSKENSVSNKWHTNDCVIVNSAFVSYTDLTTPFDCNLNSDNSFSSIESIFDSFYRRHQLPSSATVLAVYQFVASLIINNIALFSMTSTSLLPVNTLKIKSSTSI
ncbi:hypothetical protein BB561_001299 [Smittium simulii]|uniref:BZIP domain-containing protein n=1 Tax=Smittium simulii TaxID=133385 RepID=A0A2T9YV85_9FUNG|nr:hypothetical protein BB561_001299 [Smittium simulii]